MARKPKLAIIASEVSHPRFIALFEPLADRFDVIVHALQGDRVVDQRGSVLKVRLFEALPDMPGYLRGLEEELSDMDAILGIETSRLGTFQAVRAARRYGIPFGVVVNEFQPYFYERFQNIRAIQYDIRNKADRFFATTAAAAANLRLDSAPPEAIRIVSPLVDLQRFRPDPALRQKFRRYIGLSDNDLVVLFRDDLVDYTRADLALDAFLLARRQAGVMAPRLKLLIVGDGPLARELKYRCVDQNAVRSVLFLHQDPEPFLPDLYAATDLLVSPRRLPTEHHEDLPWPVLEGLAAGIAPLVGSGTVAEELVGDACVSIGADTPEAWGAALNRLAMEPASLESLKLKALSRAQSAFCRPATATFADEVEAMMREATTRGGAIGDRLAAECALMDADLRAGRDQDALIRAEEFLLLGLKSPRDHAAVLCRKGDALHAMGQHGEASRVFGEALRLDDKNPRCLRGLGYLAWQAHASEEALMYFRRAHALKDDDVETMLGIGLVYRRLGLAEEAIFWLEKCIDHEDYPPMALTALAQTCAQASRSAFGIRVLERALETVGEHKVLLMTLGQLYLNEGLTDRGDELLRRATERGA